jgi:hypothetical protein
LGASINYVTR